MAAIKLTYMTKCTASDPHIVFSATVNGQPYEHKVVLLQSELQQESTKEDAKADIVAILRDFVIRWRKANPSGTLNQLRLAVEAQEFYL